MILSIVIALLVALTGVIVFSYVFGWGRGPRLLAYAVIVPLPVIAVSLGIYALCYRSVAFSYEIWNTTIQKVVYYEKWTEEYTETETYTDSNGDTHCRVVIKHRDYPPYWVATDEYGTEWDIDKPGYNAWRDIWGNEQKVEIIRLNQSSFGDGDKYESHWGGEFDKMFPYSFVKSYENKIRCANTVWKFADVDRATRKKFPRPADNNMSPILYYGLPSQDDMLLRRCNGMWGKRYEIHNILILFNAAEYPDRSVVETVISAWQGPNKNELVTCVGIKDEAVVWCDVFSWMDDTTIHSLIRQDVSALPKFSVSGVVSVLKKYVPTKWKRKNFSDFSYIAVTIPKLSYLWIFLGSVVVATIAGFVAEHNGENMFSGMRYTKFIQE